MTQYEFNKSACVTANKTLMALSNMISYGPGKSDMNIDWEELDICRDRYREILYFDAEDGSTDNDRWHMLDELLHTLWVILRVYEENDRAPTLVEYMQVVRSATILLEHCSIVRED